MARNSFLSRSELANIGFRTCGSNVFISQFVQFYSPNTISIGSNVRIDDFCVLSGGTGIAIGDFVHIGCYSSIFGSGSVVIEDFSNISSRVAIYSESDDSSGLTLTNPMIPKKYKTKQKVAPVLCSRHSLIYTASTVLPGVTLGEGSVLGSHSLANADVEPWSIYAGVPAKKLKTRSRELLKDESLFKQELESATEDR